MELTSVGTERTGTVLLKSKKRRQRLFILYANFNASQPSTDQVNRKNRRANTEAEAGSGAGDGAGAGTTGRKEAREQAIPAL